VADPIHVLVVEDEVLVRMDIVDFLQHQGFAVSEAGNADEAIALLERHSDIRLLFADIDMPGSMDGLKLATAVRDRWPPVQIVVTSGHMTVDVADLPDGSVFFSKPYQPANITAAFRQIIGAQSLRAPDRGVDH
jgi:CheY-like chemotaxis protein